MSIKRKLVVTYLLISAIPLIFIGALSFSNARGALESTTLSSLRVIAESRESEVFLFIDKLEERTRDFASDGFIRSSLQKLEDGGREARAVREESNRHLLREKKPIDKTLLAIDVLNLEGRVVASTVPGRVGDYNPEARLFIKGTKEVFVRDFKAEMQGSGEAAWEIAAFAAIKAPDRASKTIGALVNHFDASGLNDMMTGRTTSALGALTHLRGVGESGETYIVNRDKFMITDSLSVKGASFRQKVDTHPVRRCLEEGLEASGIWPNYSGVSVAGASMCIFARGLGWTLITEQHEAEAFASIYKLRELTLILGVIALGVVGMVAYANAKAISGPIYSLQEGADIIGSGDLDYRVEVDTNDEVGALADAFNRMTDNLRAMTSSREELEREVIERKRTEERLKESQAQLVQSEKMSAVGTLVAGVAHELNNPMMGILNFIQYCLKHTPIDDKRHGVLTDAERETLRCQDIVTNLLTFSRMDKEGEEGRTRESVETLFDRVFKLLAYRLGMLRVSLNRHAAEDTPEAWMKANSIQQVFFNLVNNALDAMETAGRKELDVDIGPEGGFVRVTVADTGPGIAPQDMPNIFEAFYTTKEAGKGTGLGLSMCRSIVIEHGGDITCESKAGGGTTFTVLLPVDLRKGGMK